jgi:outer membrane protein OmpA-like peptidoglycan-associated protein
MMRRYALALLATVAASAEAYGQNAGTFELSLFPHLSYWDKSLDFDQGRAGPGGRIGFHFTDHLAIEGEGAYVPTNTKGEDADVSYIPIRAKLAYNIHAGEHTGLILGAGYVYSKYGRDADFSDNGATVGVGLRLGLGDVTSIRIDSYVDYIPSPDNGDTEVINFGFQPGLSFMFGGSRGPRDRDADGVLDNIDKCPKTPAGDKVDATGCTVKDGDSDGVLDDTDACADTPAGDKVDEKGCSLPKDADGDGVTDDKDACADTPAGDKVDEKGCSLPKDADGDGVTDDKDECANTPAGQKVNEKGCPADTDGDGVTDDADRCPSTPAGVKVDAEGCQILFEEAKKTLILEGVNFETGKATLTPESEAILNGVAESLVANEEIKVQVGGHTDNTGTRAVNQRLSKARAETVRKYLVDHGVAADRLTAVGFGPSKPVATNRTAEGRAQNRRVELTRTN